MTINLHTHLGPYEILALVGSGGMGEVYRAKDTRLEREVAIKVLPEQLALDQQALARFHREVKAVAALSHPNVLAIYDVGTEHGLTYAVMELLEGQTLRGRLKQGALPWREAVRLALAITEGLAAAHGKGIIHRDIKPENVFLTAQGGLKILDFGLARLEPKTARARSEKSEESSIHTQLGVLLGTVAYMAPEQVRGQATDARSDVFSLGCVLFEMLTGRRPFEGPTAADTMAAILHQPPPPLGSPILGRPAELEQLILRCLEKDPDRRFPSAREVATALRDLYRSTADSAAEEQLETSAYLETPHPTPHPSPVLSFGPSVAVLPFRNVSSDPENEYFSDGLAEELIGALTKVEGLHVASRTSAFAFKGRSEDVRTIGDKLNVQSVLEGSVRRAGNRLRISAQLVNAADGYHLWSETYNRELADIFEIQDEIAQSITKALRVILTQKDKTSVERAPARVESYDYYLRGLQFFHQFRRQGYEFALEMFTRAIELDPGYARAHAGIANCHSLLFMYWDTSETNLRQADETSSKALALAPQLAEAHVARGLAVSLQKQFADAEREFETAIRLDPSLFDAYYFYARACKAQGKQAEAIRLFEQALQLRPDDYQSATHIASDYRGMGHTAEYQAAVRRAIQVVEKHLELHPEDARAYYLGATALSGIGQTERAIEWASRALAMDPEEPVTLYNVACVYALQGQIESAIDCLEKSLKNGFAHKEWVEHDQDLISLHDHPRYQALLRTLEKSRQSPSGEWAI